MLHAQQDASQHETTAGIMQLAPHKLHCRGHLEVLWVLLLVRMLAADQALRLLPQVFELGQRVGDRLLRSVPSAGI